MNNLSEYDDHLESLAEAIEPQLPLYQEVISNIPSRKQPLSVFSMTSFFPKIESLRIGIFAVAEREEQYSANVLFRSLIEHVIKAQYLFMKTLENEDDRIGIEYWLFGQEQEAIDYVKALQQANAIVGVESALSPLETLKDMGLMPADKSKSQIQKKTEQFLFRNMVFHIAKKMGSKESKQAPMLSQMFPKYSNLSSFVHGGPDSVLTYDAGPGLLRETIEMATFSALYIRWLSLALLYQQDDSVGPLVNLSYKYLREFLKHSK